MEKLSQETSKTKCGTNNTGGCYPGTTINPCSNAPSGAVWLSGGTSCPSNTYCCSK
jgi:hypothetical protein